MNIKVIWQMIFFQALVLFPTPSAFAQPSRKEWIITPKAKHALQTNKSHSCSFSPDSKMLATASWGKETSSDVQIWDMATGKEKKRFKFPYRACRVAFSPDGKTLAILGQHGAGFAITTRLVFYKLPSWRPYRDIRLSHGSNTMAFSSDSKTLAAAVTWPRDANNSVVLYNVKTGKRLGALQSTQPDGWWQAVAFSGNGQFVAAGSSKGQVTWWDTRSNKEVHTLKADRRPSGSGIGVQALAFSKDGKQLAVGPMDPAIALIDTQMKKVVQWIGGGGSECVAFTPDEKRLLSNWSGALCVWSANSGKLLTRLPLHRSRIVYMAISPDGKHLVTCHFDGVAKVWDAKFYEPYIIKQPERPKYKPKPPPIFPDFRRPKNIGSLKHGSSLFSDLADGVGRERNGYGAVASIP